jgi:NTP pyrophosphatase (non-canonical NTP hydrolase)
VTKEEYDSVIENAIHFYGKINQQVKAIEELGELITSLARYLSGHSEVYSDHVREEIADAAIMLHQLALIFGPAEVDAFVEKKLTRLHNRMKNEFGENYATKKREVEGSSEC